MSTSTIDPLVRAATAPIAPWLADRAVLEIACNEPGAVWIERAGHDAMERIEVPDLDADAVRFMAERIAAASNQAVSEQNPILSAALPTGERFQCVMPPASKAGAFSIRKQVTQHLTLDDYEQMGAFEGVSVYRPGALSDTDRELIRLLDAGEIGAFIRLAVRSRISMVIAGGTSTGKTTFFNALFGAMNPDERLVTLEDTRELTPPNANFLPLLASKGDQGSAKVSIQDLLEATLRMRPDRLFLGELRGAEAFTFLRAINTGHPGSMTTIHADTPAGAYEQIALMVQQAKVNWEKEELMRYIQTVIPIVVQLRRDGGRRGVSEIFFARREGLRG